MTETDLMATYILQAEYKHDSDSFTITCRDVEEYNGELRSLRWAEYEIPPGLADVLFLNYLNQEKAPPHPSHPRPVNNWTLNFPVQITHGDLLNARLRASTQDALEERTDKLSM